eukprot:TRINITY_DN60042_c0_g1_i1.p1 TRINITY_DN60042_c0_g1~~TRINITY_DN60042_c0_g1_i1.p1  ORF type:complete len:458 (-),score=56.42 TRINITY_DN60042_c0_g1_i1:86-1459(-)
MTDKEQQKMVLHTYPDNVNCIKIHIVASIVGTEIACTPQFKMGEDNKTEEFLKMSPTGKVPVLEVPSKGAICESNAIAWYLASQDKDRKLLGRDSFEEAQVKQWLDFCNNEIVPNTFAWIGPILGFIPLDEATHNRAVEGITSAFNALNGWLQDRTWLVGDALSLADIAIASVLTVLYEKVLSPKLRKPFPCVNRWFESVASNPDFAAVKSCAPTSWCSTPDEDESADKETGEEGEGTEDKKEVEVSEGTSAEEGKKDEKQNETDKEKVEQGDKGVANPARDEAKVLFSEGKMAEALAKYEEAVQVEPANDVLYSNMCLCCINMKRNTEAMQFADLALKLSKGKNAKAWYRRAHIFRDTTMSAIAAFYDCKQAYKLEPENKQVKAFLYDLRGFLQHQNLNWVECERREEDVFWMHEVQLMYMYKSPFLRMYWEEGALPLPEGLRKKQEEQKAAAKGP